MLAASPSAASGLSFRRSEEIADLIDLFSKTQYRAKEVTPRVEAIEKRCLELFARDYKYSIIQNSSGEVCGHYPRQIVFLEYESTDGDRDRDSEQRAANMQRVKTELLLMANRSCRSLSAPQRGSMRKKKSAKQSFRVEPATVARRLRTP